MRTPASVDDIRELLPSLAITLAAHATDAVPSESGNKASASGKHDMNCKTILASEVSDIVSVGEHTYALWKPTLHLPRPRARLQRPAVYFTVHLTLSSKAITASNQNEVNRLKSFEPLPANVLEPLRFDPTLRESNMYLSEARITKSETGAIRPRNDLKPIRGASKRAFPIVPALFTRIRYSSVPDAMIASLHVETSQLVNGAVNINSVALDAPNAKVHSLCPLESPRQSWAGDETVLLYKLSHADESALSTPSAVFVKINADVSLDDRLLTSIEIKWQAQVDLSQTSAKPTCKWSRPLSGIKQLPMRPLSEGSARPPSIEVNQPTTPDDTSIVFSFTGTPTVKRNEDFELYVQCINRSNRARRFALVVLQPKHTRSRQQNQQPGPGNADLIATLFNAPPLERQKSPDVLDLNPDVRIGPLPPGACFEAPMRFRALATGVLDLGIIRIVDLDSRKTVDVKELPDIISIEGSLEDDDGRTKAGDDLTSTKATIIL